MLFCVLLIWFHTHILRHTGHIGGPWNRVACDTVGKVAEQKEKGAALQGYSLKIKNYKLELRGIIQIASYALQLEQLMDASAALNNLKMRRFWKRKIGISKVRCLVAELLEAFLDDRKAEIAGERAKSPPDGHSPREKVGEEGDNEVAFSRFLDLQWNLNRDKEISVYELAGALQKVGGWFGTTWRVTTSPPRHDEAA